MIAYPITDVTNIYSGEKTYTEKILENSPLERVLEQKQIGNDWNDKSLKFTYDVVTSGDMVKRFSTTTTWENGATKSIPSNAGIYQNGQLYKSTIKNEDGNIIIKFENGNGQLILTRKVMSATENADTYYIYNEYNQLAFVVPPLLAKIQSWSQADQDNLAYEYRYDTKGRQVEKKLPGKGWEYLVYDKQNRVVGSQDANLKEKGQWLYTKYDQFGRVAITGLSTGGERLQEQNIADSYGSNNVNRLTSALFERQGMEVYYGNPDATYPNSTKWVSLLSLNYYDIYPPLPSGAVFPDFIAGQKVMKQPGQSTTSKNTKSLLLAAYVKNVEDDAWTRNYTYYDEKGRTIGSYAGNHLGGYTRTESEVDFAGVTKQSKVYHKRLSADVEKVITQTYIYDHQNRLLVHKHQVDNNPEEILVQNEYNELSQLKNKKLGGTNPSQPIQSIDYTYNIRGWLTKINDPSNLNGKLFGYELRYNNPVNANVAPGKFAGTITEVDWKNASEEVLKRYNYSYDGLNRLQDAVYSEPNSTVPFNNNYNEHVTYDFNGNIKTLKRNAFPSSGSPTSTQVDDLIYEYTGNRLTKVVENALNDTGYEGGNNTILYDLNGNMKDMKDKGVQSITYNFLNQTNQMAILQKDLFGQLSNSYSYISYLYRADGVKLRKTYSSTPSRGLMSTRMTDYLDGFQYSYSDGGGICLECRTENAYEEQAYKSSSITFPGIGTPEWKLDFVATAEGFYSFTENRYIYQYRDHLGNTRVSFAKNSTGVPEITDTNNYYPFGLNHISGQFSTANFGSYYSYKYNGKELQETGMYDYGARMMMPDLGRWGVMDAMSEKYSSWSPYNYAINNPVMVIDPDGNDAMFASGEAAQAAFRSYVATMSTSTESSGGNIFTGFGRSFGEDPNDPKPGFWRSVGNFFSKWFRGGKTGSLEVGSAERITAEDYSASGSRLFGLIQGANYNPMAEYRARRDNPFYNDGESSLDRSFRLMNSSHIEIMQDFGGGGYNMFGGYGRITKAANAVAAVDETGNSLSKMLSSVDEFDPLVTLYRGSSGSEIGSEFLFLTDNIDYAASYIKNGGTINQYQISRSGLYILEHTQRLSINPNGQHVGISGTFSEYLFTGKDVVQALNKIAKPHVP
ncbi:RHS repeat-associated core domain-containing protein [Chryseobacterium arthrosphaerae]|nr:RHS repeat-associated core domain-containing protein [Chryseobacterium arthrosphaerae]